MSHREILSAPCVWIAAAVLSCLFASGLGIHAGGPREKVDRGAATAGAAVAIGAAQQQALVRLQAATPSARVAWNPERGTPAFVWARGGLVETDLSDPAQALRAYVAEHCELFDTCSSQLEWVDVPRQRSSADGTTRVAIRQQIAGRPLYLAGVGATFDGEGRLIGLASSLRSSLRPGPPPVLTADQLTDLAIGYAGAEEQRSILELKSEEIAFPLSGEARPAQQVWLRGDHDTDYLVIVDAVDGSLLLRSNLIVEAQGTVFQRPPNDLQIPGEEPVQPTVVAFDGDPVASPVGWVTDLPGGPERTSGNNVWLSSYKGKDGTTFFTLVPESEGGDFQYDWARAYTDCKGQNFNKHVQDCHQPTDDPALGAVNLFYHANKIHDILYELGFDESAGNFQEDNFGLPGGGDAIEIETNAYAFGLACNARFFPAPDGARALIQMGLFAPGCFASAGWVDSSLDPDVFYHEYGHGLSSRLVGLTEMNPNTFSGGLLGEGWGDFLAAHLMSGPDAPGAEASPAGPYPYGEYEVSGGGRRYPMAVSMSANPLTFADLCDGGTCEIHDDGEIWANMLWEARYALIGSHGFSQGKDRMGRLLVDSMKNLAGGGTPDMITARDAMLVADQVRYDGEGCQDLWSAFTGRGLGPDATFGNAQKTQAVPDTGPLADGDADGIADLCDACPADPDDDQDGDGLCGDVDPCPVDPNNDIDGDGFCSNSDNCPSVSNPDQTDSDNDGTGDACEPPSGGGGGCGNLPNGCTTIKPK